jgi:secondary thiamine-phosphate synthase enzyme
MITHELSTPVHDALVDITPQVRAAIRQSGVRAGVCLVHCPHTTAAVTVNENADPDVPADLLVALERAVPWRGAYRHAEGNSAAHVKASLVGCSVQLIVSDGEPVLGTWQSVFFCEFDGPRHRRFHIQVSGA